MKIKKYFRLFISISILITTYGFINTITTESIFISTATLEPKKSLNNDSNSPFSGIGVSGISSSLFSNSNKSNDVVLALELLRSKDFFEELLLHQYFIEQLNTPTRTNYLKTFLC